MATSPPSSRRLCINMNKVHFAELVLQLTIGKIYKIETLQQASDKKVTK